MGKISTAALNVENSGTQSNSKDTDYFPKRQVRLLFLSGRRLTAKQINQEVGGNDARKVISDLRKEGWNIKDIRMENNCKLYWLAVNPEPTLFDQV